MTARVATFRNRRYNSYVPAAAYAADVSSDGPYQVDYGMAPGANPTLFLNAASVAVAGTYQGTAGAAPFTTDVIPDTFGRNVQVVAGGANATTVTVRGRDYLGQPMREDIVLNGATAVFGVKAFKWIDSITYTATAGGTISFGTGPRFGVPYRFNGPISTACEEANGVAGTTGTFTAGNITDPATAVTTDPRGLYTPNTPPDGTKRIRVSFFPNNLLNANGNGGLYGLPHYYG